MTIIHRHIRLTAILVMTAIASVLTCRGNEAVLHHLGNNSLDVSVTSSATGQSSVAINQSIHYYPFGLPMDCSHFPDYQRWLFGDKEFDRTHGLDLYDQAARQYDPTLGRFRRPDPLAEKYHPLSPYLFCAANPLLFIDRTGKDYSVTAYDDKVVIAANYYINSDSKESANLAAKLWNNQSNKYEINGLPIVFQLDVIVVDMANSPIRADVDDRESRALKYAASCDENKIGNTYMLSGNLDETKNGSTLGGAVIEVRPERSNTQTGPHEMGHTLGLDHYNRDLMTPSPNDPTRTDKVNSKMVKDIIKGALGKPKSKDAGKGHFIDKSNGKFNSHKKIEVTKIEPNKK